MLVCTSVFERMRQWADIGQSVSFTKQRTRMFPNWRPPWGTRTGSTELWELQLWFHGPELNHRCMVWLRACRTRHKVLIFSDQVYKVIQSTEKNHRKISSNGYFPAHLLLMQNRNNFVIFWILYMEMQNLAHWTNDFGFSTPLSFGHCASIPITYWAMRKRHRWWAKRVWLN